MDQARMGAERSRGGGEGPAAGTAASGAGALGSSCVAGKAAMADGGVNGIVTAASRATVEAQGGAV